MSGTTAALAARLLGAEVRKAHRLHLLPLAAAGASAVAALSALPAASAATGPERRWDELLAGASLAVPLVFPLLVAVLASRLVDAEHQGRGWVLWATTGTSPGRLLRSKWCVAAGVLAAGALVQALLLAAAGGVLGAGGPVPWARLVLATACALAVHLALLAGHLLLAAVVENQLVGLGVGLLGSLAAGVSAGAPALAPFTPWGGYVAVRAADYQDGALVILTPSAGTVLVLLGVAGAVFAVVTARMDGADL